MDSLIEMKIVIDDEWFDEYKQQKESIDEYIQKKKSQIYLFIGNQEIKKNGFNHYPFYILEYSLMRAIEIIPKTRCVIEPNNKQLQRINEPFYIRKYSEKQIEISIDDRMAPITQDKFIEGLLQSVKNFLERLKGTLNIVKFENTRWELLEFLLEKLKQCWKNFQEKKINLKQKESFEMIIYPYPKKPEETWRINKDHIEFMNSVINIICYDHDITAGYLSDLHDEILGLRFSGWYLRVLGTALREPLIWLKKSNGKKRDITIDGIIHQYSIGFKLISVDKIQTENYIPEQTIPLRDYIYGVSKTTQFFINYLLKDLQIKIDESLDLIHLEQDRINLLESWKEYAKNNNLIK